MIIDLIVDVVVDAMFIVIFIHIVIAVDNSSSIISWCWLWRTTVFRTTKTYKRFFSFSKLFKFRNQMFNFLNPGSYCAQRQLFFTVYHLDGNSSPVRNFWRKNKFVELLTAETDDPDFLPPHAACGWGKSGKIPKPNYRWKSGPNHRRNFFNGLFLAKQREQSLTIGK